MKLKTFTLLLAFILCGSFTLLAQNNNNPNAGSNNNNNKRETTFVQGHLSRLKAEVQLTADQEKEISKILKTLFQERDKIQKQASKSNKEKIKEKKPVQEVYMSQLNAILTEEQQEQLQQKAEERIEAGIQLIKSMSNNSQ